MDSKKRNISYGGSVSDDDDGRRNKRKKSNGEEEIKYGVSTLTLDASNSYSASGAKHALHGTIYQLKLLMLFLKRGLDEGYKFRLATEMDAAEKFDDLVFEKFQKGERKYRFLQAKHKQAEEKQIRSADLFNDKGGEFSLLKYFKSYCKIKLSPTFKEGVIEDVTLCTNIDFDTNEVANAGIILTEINSNDPLLDAKIEGKISSRYKLAMNAITKKEFYERLKKTSDVYELAKATRAVKLDLNVPILKSYHAALVQQNVIQIGKMTNSRVEGKWAPDFIQAKNLTAGVGYFRDALMNVVGTQWVDFVKIPLNLSSGFSAVDPHVSHDLPKDFILDKDVDEFFEKLVFAVNQPNEIELSSILGIELGERFNVSDSDFVNASFEKEVLDWMKLKEGKYFTKGDVQKYFQEIFQKLGSLYLVGITTSYCDQLNKSGLLFAENVLEKTIAAMLTKADSKATKARTICFLTSHLQLAAIQLNQALEKSQYAPHLKTRGSYIFAKLSSLLRVSNLLKDAFNSSKTNLLLVECDNKNFDFQTAILFNELFDILCSNPNKTMILIADENFIANFRTKPGQSNVHCNHFYLNDLTRESQESVLNKNIKFQEREIALKHLFGGTITTEKWNSIVDAHVLSTLINNAIIEVGNNVLENQVENDYEEKYYIQRRFTFQKVEIESRLQHMGTAFPDLLVYSKEDFDLKCISDPNRNIHWLTVENRKFIWQRSRGNISELRPFIKHITYESFDNSTIRGDDDRICIISDIAGMGKSTFLTYQSQKIKETASDVWVARFDLNQYTDVLKNRKPSELTSTDNGESAVHFLLTKFLKLGKNENILERKLFEESFRHDRGIELLFDGFDEISPDYKDDVICLLKSLRKTKVRKIWLTSRPHMKEELENRLGLFSDTMIPFSKQDQIQCITNYWMKKTEGRLANSQEKVKELAADLVNQMSTSINDKECEFTGIPLQSVLFAGVYLSEVENHIKGNSKISLPTEFTLLDLYEDFIVKKGKIFKEEKNCSDLSKPGVMAEFEGWKSQFEKECQRLAMFALFSREALVAIFSHFDIEDIEENIENSTKRNTLERSGIITQVSNNYKPVFIHRTFAEYFAEKFLATTYVDKKGREEI